jgi:hypothetical protein
MNPELSACLARLYQCRILINDVAEPRPHSCHPAYCNPMNEYDVMRTGVLPAGSPHILKNVWLCRYNGYHVCDHTGCDQAIDGTCPISGLCFALNDGNTAQWADYDTEDVRTWNPKTMTSTKGYLFAVRFL